MEKRKRAAKKCCIPNDVWVAFRVPPDWKLDYVAKGLASAGWHTKSAGSPTVNDLRKLTVIMEIEKIDVPLQLPSKKRRKK